MGKKEHSDIGKQIEDLVQNAIDTLDFEHLSNRVGKAVDQWNQDIQKKVKPSIDQAKESVAQAKDEILRSTDDIRSAATYNLKNLDLGKKLKKNITPVKKANIVRVNKRNSIKVKGVLYTVFSSIGLGIFGIVALSVAVTFGISSSGTIVLGILTLVCALFLYKGIEILKKYNRMLRYIELLKNKGYIDIQELEEYVLLDEKKVLKEVKEMLSLGMLPEGRLDKKQKCLIGTYEIYKQYCQAEANMQKREQEKIRQEEIKRSLSEEEREMWTEIEEGKAQILEIRRLNDELPDPIISEKLYRLEKISEKIFSYVEKHPDQMEEIRRLKTYYLPTILKLVTAYQNLQQEEIVGKNMKTMCVQIEDTLDTMNTALEYMYDELYADKVLDVTTDISVLKTMLAREGLVRDDFVSAKEDKENE